MIERVNEAVDFIKSRVDMAPDIMIITGTGLGSITANMEIIQRIPYTDIPHFCVSTVKGHKGSLTIGRIAEKNIIAMEGRFHLYEGYTAQEVTFPIRVISQLGARYLMISSAAGGLNPSFKAGDFMLLTDHINLMGENPLIGPEVEEFGSRFPDMVDVYDRELMDIARENSKELGIELKEGVYVGVLGPSLETPAETRFLRMIGADAVGMSTVQEVIVGVHSGMRIIAIAVITNVKIPEEMEKTDIDDVVSMSERVAPILGELWLRIIKELGSGLHI